MSTVSATMVSLLPAAICAQRPGDAIHGCTATLLRPEVSAIWPELGNESFQNDSRCDLVVRNDTAKERGRHPSTHDATYLRPRIDRPRGSRPSNGSANLCRNENVPFRQVCRRSAKEEEKSDREQGGEREQYDRKQKGHSHCVTTFGRPW